MIEFREGDKVRIKKGLISGEKYGTIDYFGDMMKQSKGGDLIIACKSDSGNYYLANYLYILSPEMLYKVNDDFIQF